MSLARSSQVGGSGRALGRSLRGGAGAEDAKRGRCLRCRGRAWKRRALEATPTRGLMALVPAAAAKQEGEGSHVPLRLARLRSLVGGRREQCPWLEPSAWTRPDVWVVGALESRAGSRFRRPGQPVRYGERSDSERLRIRKAIRCTGFGWTVLRAGA